MSTIFAGGLRKSKSKVDFEARWVMAARAGYVLAFEELVTRNESGIYRLALNITQNQQDAEDLLQGTFVEAQELLHEYRRASSFFTWLMRVCIREATEDCRRRASAWSVSTSLRSPTSDLMLNEVGEWGDRPEQRYRKTELNRLLSEAIGKLNFVHRIVFLLCDVERFSTEDIADLLGLSVSETRSHLLRARSMYVNT